MRTNESEIRDNLYEGVEKAEIKDEFRKLARSKFIHNSFENLF